MPLGVLRGATILLCWAISASGTAHLEGGQHPTVVKVDKSPSGVAYTVDSEGVGSTPTSDLLYLLNQVRHRRGENAPVVVLVDPRVPIDQIWDVDGTAAKAQLNNLHYFIVNRDTGKMAEIKWGPAVPYSTNPPLN